MANGDGIDIEGTAAKVSGGRPWLIYGALAGGAIGLVVLVMRSMQSGDQAATDPNAVGGDLPVNAIVALGSLQNQLLEYTGAQSIWNREEEDRDSQILASVGLARGDILSAKNLLLAGQSDILAGTLAAKTEILSMIGATEADILAGVTASRGDVLAALNTLSGRVLSGDAQILNAVHQVAELEGWTSEHILRVLGDVQYVGLYTMRDTAQIKRELEIGYDKSTPETRQAAERLSDLRKLMNRVQDRVDSIVTPVGAGGAMAGTIFDTVWSLDAGNGTGSQWFAKIR